RSSSVASSGSLGIESASLVSSSLTLLCTSSACVAKSPTVLKVARSGLVLRVSGRPALHPKDVVSGVGVTTGASTTGTGVSTTAASGIVSSHFGAGPLIRVVRGQRVLPQLSYLPNFCALTNGCRTSLQ